jgi:hypothetical protein
VSVTRTRVSFLMLALAANLVLLGGVEAGSAHACSCAGGVSLERQIRSSDAVFSGEVESIEPGELAPGGGPPLGRVTFDAKEVWKGAQEGSVVVYGYGDEVTCGIEFERGESYLVYAQRSSGDEGKPLETDFCGPTKPLERADGDLLVLGDPDVPIPDTGGYVFSPAAGTVAFASLFLGRSNRRAKNTSRRLAHGPGLIAGRSLKLLLIGDSE